MLVRHTKKYHHENKEERAMKIVVVHSPKLLSGLLRFLFHI